MTRLEAKKELISVIDSFENDTIITYDRETAFFHSKEYKQKYVDKIIKIEDQEYQEYESFANYPKDQSTIFLNSLGIFKCVLKTGEVIYSLTYILYSDHYHSIDTVYIAERKDFIKAQMLLFNEQEKLNRLKNDIYQTHSSMMGCFHSEKEVPTFPVYHPINDIIDEDIKLFFDNIEHFKRFNQPPVRKVLNIGSPGTGKTSMSYRIARNYSKEMPVAFCGNLKELNYHLEVCANQNSPTIAFLEDADDHLYDPNSWVLNWLDGDKMVNVTQGAYIIMSTNYPSKIDNRIKRPGRIDRVYTMNPLKEDKYLEPVLKLYLPKSVEITSEIVDLFRSRSGAEIKELANASLIHSVSNFKESLDVDDIKNVIAQWDKYRKEADEYDQEKFGFMLG